MKVKTIKTHKIVPFQQNLFEILDRYVNALPEKSVLVITSKIVAICEQRVIKHTDIEKDKLIVDEAESYISPKSNDFGFFLTIKNGVLIVNSGVDRSNGNGYNILWPNDPQKSANEIREYLKKRFALQHVGVVITDSKVSPLRWGETGVAIAHSGFMALNNYLDKSDIFGNNLKFKKVNVMDGLASAAVVVMGEGNEQTPLAVITDLPFVKFTNGNPTKTEIDSLKINMSEDVYCELLKSAKWKKGGTFKKRGN